MSTEKKSGIRRGEAAFLVAIVLGVVLGVFIRKVTLGILLGLIVGGTIVFLGWIAATRK